MTLKDKITSTHEGLLAWHQERVIFETTNLMCELMDQTGVSRKELADRMGRTKGYITQLLDGTANMTLRTVSDVFVALGRQFHPAQSPLELSETFVAEVETLSLGFTTSAVTADSTAGTLTMSLPAMGSV